MGRNLRAHLRILAKQTRLMLAMKRAAKKMHAKRVRAEADVKVAHRALKVAIHLRNVEVVKAKKAHRSAVMAQKRMREAVRRAAAALIRRRHAERVSRKAQL